MYGFMNQGLKDLVLTRYGRPTWTEITKRAGVTIDEFLAMSPYPDELTDRLLRATSELLCRSTAAVWSEFGEFWIEYMDEHGYGEMLDLLGADLPSFLLALDGMHDRFSLTFPGLEPPSIWCSNVTSGSLTVHYASARAELAPFLVGVLRSAACRFGEQVEITLVRGRADGHDHEEYHVVRRPAEPRGLVGAMSGERGIERAGEG